MILSKKQFKEFAPKARNRTSLYRELEDILPEYGIDNESREAAFLSQCHYESGGFKVMKENLNYSAQGLNDIFAKYFRRAGVDPYDYARKPEKIANIVYANRMDNGNAESGDGWKFRGRGYIQLTGRFNYTRFAENINKDIDDTIAYLETVKGAVHSACWYWDEAGLNSFADRRDIVTVTRRINGGYHGLDSRIMLFNQVIDMMDAGHDDNGLGERMDIVLQYGDRRHDVKDLQRALGLKVDGWFGENTKTAVKKFQRKIGVTADGVADQYTLTKLYTGL